jgi:hypothetical protein
MDHKKGPMTSMNEDADEDEWLEEKLQSIANRVEELAKD